MELVPFKRQCTSDILLPGRLIVKSHVGRKTDQARSAVIAARCGPKVSNRLLSTMAQQPIVSGDPKSLDRHERRSHGRIYTGNGLHGTARFGTVADQAA